MLFLHRYGSENHPCFPFFELEGVRQGEKSKTSLTSSKSVA